MSTEIWTKEHRKADAELVRSRRAQRTEAIRNRFDFKKHSDSIPALMRGTYLRSQETHSLASAIKAKCQECVGYEDVSNRVSGCSTYRCPLWKYRPYQDKGEE